MIVCKHTNVPFSACLCGHSFCWLPKRDHCSCKASMQRCCCQAFHMSCPIIWHTLHPTCLLTTTVFQHLIALCCCHVTLTIRHWVNKQERSFTKEVLPKSRSFLLCTGLVRPTIIPPACYHFNQQLLFELILLQSNLCLGCRS